jgi:hypothetical protein
MPLHMIKLAVGVDSIAHLRTLQANRRKERRQKPSSPHWVYTRNSPKREDDLLDGGSLYWIIRGFMRARQTLVGFDEDVDDEGRKYCKIKIQRTVVPVAPVAWKPFQGWRYMEADKAPADLSRGDSDDMPQDMANELRKLGLL